LPAEVAVAQGAAEQPPLPAEVMDRIAAAQDRARRAVEEAGQLQRLAGRTTVGGRADAAAGVIVADPADLTVTHGKAVEDMAVMGHIIDAAVGHGGPSVGFAALDIVGRPEPPRCLYLHGYGALFVTDVGFALVAPPPQPATEPAEEPASRWERTRRQLYGPHPEPVPMPGAFMMAPGTGEAVAIHRPGQPYEAQRVEDLRRSLIDALREAAHMELLGPDDLVTVVVTGPGAPSEAPTAVAMARGAGAAPDFGALRVHIGQPTRARSTLTATVRKRNAADLLAGEITPQQFEEAVRFTTQ